MAKRRRLEAPGAAELADLEAGFAAKQMPDRMGPDRIGPDRLGLTAPITQVAAEAARAASPLDIDQRVTNAQNSVDAGAWRDAVQAGRVISDLPLDAIDLGHLTRDRMIVEADDLEELKASIRTNGMRLPIEVVALPDGRYGLVSGWRRMTVLLTLSAESRASGGQDFATVKAIVRPPYEAGVLYTAMVEENELRAQLTPYERGRIAVVAAENGAFSGTESAIETIFATASRAKRSKIRSFAKVHQLLGDVLHFPTDLSERNGLRLAYALREGSVQALRQALMTSTGEGGIEGPAREWAMLEPIVAASEAQERPAERGGRPKAQITKPVSPRQILASGISMQQIEHEDGYSIRLRGASVDAEMMARVMAALERMLNRP